jgi:AcrR family transcriptional regulator
MVMFYSRMATMPEAPQQVGRRERNKQQKLDRIMAAASRLFDAHGLDDVTTHQVAAEAGIGSGTLFLYARNKGELLLLVQTARFRTAVEEGRAASEGVTGIMDGVLAIVRPVVAFNRERIDNGRSYLREMLFGDANEPHHAEALRVVAVMEDAIATVLRRSDRIADPATLAENISSVMFVTLAAARNLDLDPPGLVDEIRRQIAVLIPD